MSLAKPIVVCLGEVLWDVLPTGKILGGAPANVAWHASQLGADSRIVSAVGQDEPGREILGKLAEMGLDRDLVAEVRQPTSRVEASVNAYGVANYVIHREVAWDYIPVTDQAIATAGQAKAINFGSLAQRTPTGRKTVQTLLDRAPADCLKVFDINLRPGFVQPEVLREGFVRATLVKLNADELLFLGELFAWSGPPSAIMDALLAAHPGVEHVVVTRGGDGADWKTREKYLRRPGRTVPIADTIGAGDSFTAAVIMGLLAGMDPEEITEAALDISSYVCTRAGATPLLPERLRRLFSRHAGVPRQASSAQSIL